MYHSNRGAGDTHYIQRILYIYVYSLCIQTSLTRFITYIILLLLLLYDRHRAGLNERALLPIIPISLYEYH